MQNIKKTLLTATLAAGLTSLASAATIELDVADVQFDTAAGQTGTLQVIIDTAPENFPFNNGGVGISVTSSNPGVIAITDATVSSPEFFSGSFVRWDGTEVSGLSADGIEVLSGAAVNGIGLNGDAPFSTNADGPGGTFIFAEIGYQVLGEGTTTISLGTITARDGDFLISAGQDVTGSLDFGSTTFNVVPEPGSLALLGLGGLLIARRRRG